MSEKSKFKEKCPFCPQMLHRKSIKSHVEDVHRGKRGLCAECGLIGSFKEVASHVKNHTHLHTDDLRDSSFHNHLHAAPIVIFDDPVWRKKFTPKASTNHKPGMKALTNHKPGISSGFVSRKCCLEFDKIARKHHVAETHGGRLFQCK